MAEGFNKAILIGNLGRDPELKYTTGGKAVLKFRMATTESWRDKEGEKKEHTEWHNITVWGRRAEALNKILHSGKRLAVEGRIRTTNYEGQDGARKYFTEVVAQDIVLLAGRRDQGPGQGTGPAMDHRDNGAAEEPRAATAEDIPF